MSGLYSELFGWFFPEESALFRKKAKDAAESRFQAGIHFRSDNEAGLALGRKVAGAVIEKLEKSGADNPIPTAKGMGKPVEPVTAKARTKKQPERKSTTCPDALDRYGQCGLKHGNGTKMHSRKVN